MESENSLVQQSFGALSHGEGSPIGLHITRDFADFDEFKSFCESLAKVRSFGPFAVGDIFAKAVAQFGEKKAMADTLCEIASHTPAWVRKCTEVAQAIPYEYRRMTSRYMSFEHHVVAAKVKGHGCDDHHEFPIRNPAECAPCEVARITEIANWLETAEKKKWSAKELKDRIGSGKSTTVREHQRNLDGGEFDPEPLKESIGVVKHYLSAIKESTSGVIDKNKLNRGNAKRLLKNVTEGAEALDGLKKILESHLT
jgi:hypothetical protein